MKSTTASGFTLIELMVTLTMVGILLTIGVPTFRETIRNGILATEMNEFVSTLNFARSEAVKRAMNVTVRRTVNNWEEGWQVFTDENASGTMDGADQTLLVHGALRTNYTLRGNQTVAEVISFISSGASNKMGSFALCDNSDGKNTPKYHTSRLITINSLGRITVGRDNNHNGIPEDTDGKDLASCINP